MTGSGTGEEIPRFLSGAGLKPVESDPYKHDGGSYGSHVPF